MSSGSGTHPLGLAGTEPVASRGPSPRTAPGRPEGPGSRRPHAPRRLSPRLPWPDPPLVDAAAGIRLRPWTTSAGDVDALVAAWADPVIAAANGVPRDRSAPAAARWLAGDPARVAAGRCLDLVISPLDSGGPTDSCDPAGGLPVLGEVGLRNIDRVHRRAEISWWIAPANRGRGLATAATRLLSGWALSAAGGGLVQVWARIDPVNTHSARVAAAAGLERRGTVEGVDVWSVAGR